MSNLYRLYPTLWNDGDGQYQQALTVYAIDCGSAAPLFPTACSRRPREDPVFFWGSPTFQRILPPSSSPGQPNVYGALTSVSWSGLIAWIQSVAPLGYTIQGDLSKLKAYSDVYILGP
jgi:hypothetical protein